MMGEVTSSWMGGPVNETLLALRETREDLARRVPVHFEDMDVDEEPRSPRRARRFDADQSDFNL